MTVMPRISQRERDFLSVHGGSGLLTETESYRIIKHLHGDIIDNHAKSDRKTRLI